MQTDRARESKKMEPRCVECGFPIKTLFVQYSPGNIRLMRCENCKAVADEYIECEFMIILIDLILHKTKAYRHLLFNVINQHTVNFEGCFAGFVVEVNLCVSSSGWLSLLLKRNEGEWGSSMSFSSIVWTFEEIIVDVFVGNFVFFCIFLLSMRLMLNTSIQISRCKDILLAVLVSSYFKIFLIATMVWEFPPSVIFIIDLFVLSSNTVALKVITDSAMNRCIAACFCAQALKLLVTQGPARRSLRFQSIDCSFSLY
ncbi:protein ARV 2 isoform X1 [Populus alba]|uniref:protein ARV 2 isoform X1 n=1 Tax=Populus alba TaxID=43335 RepID=UPI00158E6E89|nr:protein ARV 2-like isoform X1 [Populus alba]